MNKKIIIAIVIILIILAAIGLIINNEFQNQRVKVGDIYFQLPENYHEGNLNELGHVNITDGVHCIFLTSVKDGNITEYVNQYVDDLSNKNQSISLSDFTVNGVHVYKSTNAGTGSNHYWFVKDGNMYSLYNWEENPDMDNICINLINSM